MKKLLGLSVVLAASFAVSNAQAYQLVSSWNYTCADLRALVQSAPDMVGIQMPLGYAVYEATPAGQVSDGNVFGTKDKGMCNVGTLVDLGSGGDGGGL